MKMLLALEGPSDLRRIRWLIDHWLGETVDWFAPENPASCRELIGVVAGQEFVAIKSISKLRKELVRGGFGGPHPRGDAGTISDLRIILTKLELSPDVVVWLRDADGWDLRAAEAVAYLEDAGESERFIVGYPQQVSEAWVLVGWVAESPEEESAEARVRASCTRRLPRDAHLFTHKDEPGGAKWAVRELAPTHPRERRALLRAWSLADAEVAACGLSVFRRAMNNHIGLRRALGLSTRVETTS